MNMSYYDYNIEGMYHSIIQLKEIGNDKKGVQSGHVMNTLLIAMITHKHSRHFTGVTYGMKSKYSDEP